MIPREKLLETLRRYWGYERFRPLQLETIEDVCAGRDTLVLMPTGGGKSLIYQVPALASEGVCIVITPLISLMKDQVESLTQAGVHAAYLNSSLTPAQYSRALHNLSEGVYKLVYVAPERLSTENFRTAVENLNISLIAVDEAHCVSQWGQDFRPDYLKIAEFAESLKNRPTIGAFTATATKAVRKDIAEHLHLIDPVRITTGFDRPNLYFGVQMPHSKALALLKLIEERPGKCGIVYCSTRRTVEEVDALLNDKGIPSTRYHAGLPEEERRQNQDDFVYDRKPIMVATNAFGMGIDKSNVSFVIHYNMPKNLESYYQEAGRAGRDGSPAECILLYSPQDVRTNRYLIENSDPNPDLDFETQEKLIQREYDRLRKMNYYCITAGCLRAYILNYFGEPIEERFGEPEEENCGNCSSCAGGSVLVEATVEAQQVLSCVARTGQRLGISMICDILRGSENERVLQMNLQTQSTYGLMREKPIFEIKRIIDALLMQELLIQTDGQYPVLKLTQNARPVLLGEKSFEMRIPVPQEKAKKPDKAAGDADPELFARLKKLRAALAAKASVPAYVVFTDATLRDMCAKMPTDEQELLQISGVGERKAHRYGKAFLEEINRKAEEE